MTLTLNLSPEQEAKLSAEARARGQSKDEYVLSILNAALGHLSPTPNEAQCRQAGLGLGAVQMSEDFDAPLPDEFWLGPV